MWFSKKRNRKLKSASMTQDKKLLLTMTGEVFHPTRLSYQVSDQDALLRIFRRLNCVEYDKTYSRWVWLYQGEAKALKFSQTPMSLPKGSGPIVLGSFFLKSNNEVHLDVRSFDRATKAVVFFDRYLPRKVVRVKDIAIVNACFEYTTKVPTNFDAFFETDRVKQQKPQAVLEALEPLQAIADVQERRARMSSHMTGMMKARLPDVERFPTHYYKDGIQSLELALRTREIVSLEHWKGNERFSMFDVIGSLVR
ncbi:MAG: hypothetical protein WA970_10325 [Gammaproteobacteria bacterium]